MAVIASRLATGDKAKAEKQLQEAQEAEESLFSRLFGALFGSQPEETRKEEKKKRGQN